MSEGSKERSLQQLAKSRRDYLAQVKMLTVDECAQEAAKVSKALGIKEPKGTAAAAALDAARGAYIRSLDPLRHKFVESLDKYLHETGLLVDAVG